MTTQVLLIKRHPKNSIYSAHHHGIFQPNVAIWYRKFLQRCAAIGIDGLIIPDLPVDVYADEYKTILKNIA
jgi:tryptophan synthase alpha chain